MPSDSLHPLLRVLGGSRGKSDRGFIEVILTVNDSYTGEVG